MSFADPVTSEQSSQRSAMLVAGMYFTLSSRCDKGFTNMLNFALGVIRWKAPGYLKPPGECPKRPPRRRRDDPEIRPILPASLDKYKHTHIIVEQEKKKMAPRAPPIHLGDHVTPTGPVGRLQQKKELKARIEQMDKALDGEKPLFKGRHAGKRPVEGVEERGEPSGGSKSTGGDVAPTTNEAGTTAATSSTAPSQEKGGGGGGSGGDGDGNDKRPDKAWRADGPVDSSDDDEDEDDETCGVGEAVGGSGTYWERGYQRRVAKASAKMKIEAAESARLLAVTQAALEELQRQSEKQKAHKESLESRAQALDQHSQEYVDYMAEKKRKKAERRAKKLERRRAAAEGRR